MRAPQAQDIRWDVFEKDLKDFPLEDNKWDLKKFDERSAYLASRTAAMRLRIESSFSGEQQKRELEKLKSVFTSTLDVLAQSCLNHVKCFLEDYSDEERGKIFYNIVVDGVTGATEQFYQYLSQKPDFGDLKTKLDDEPAASLLRQKEILFQPADEQKSEDAFVILDLLKCSEWENLEACYSMDEERLGLNFAMLMMKADILRKVSNVDPELECTIHRVLRDFMSVRLDHIDRRLEKLRKGSPDSDRQQKFVKLNRWAVWDIYHKTMERYQASGNVLEALEEGGRYGMRRSEERGEDGIVRHIGNSAYWKDFFAEEAETSTDNCAAYRRYLEEWEHFKVNMDFK